MNTAHGDVLTEVRIEGREHPETVRHGTAEKFGQEGTHLFGGVVGGVQAGGDAAGFVAHVVHELLYFGRVERTPQLDVFQKFVQCHKCLYFDCFLRCGKDTAGFRNILYTYQRKRGGAVHYLRMCAHGQGHEPYRLYDREHNR